MFGEAQHAGARINEAARGLVGVTEQALPQRQRINGHRQAIDQRVPTIRLVAFDGMEVALHHALIAQGAQLPQLVLADAVAGWDEGPQDGLPDETAVEGDEFAHLVASRMAVGVPDDRQLEGKQDLGMVIAQELPERGKVMDGRQAQGGGNRAERDQAVRGAELLGQGMPIAQPLGGVAQSQL